MMNSLLTVLRLHHCLVQRREQRENPFAHAQPNSFRHGGNIPPLWAFSEGSDVRLAALSWNAEMQVVLARSDSDIRTVADLRGRKLSVPRRLHDSIDFWRATMLQGYQSALSIAGLTERDVEFVEIPIARAWLDDSPRQNRAQRLNVGSRLNPLISARGSVRAIDRQS